jgi:hypothetical protein
VHERGPSHQRALKRRPNKRMQLVARSFWPTPVWGRWPSVLRARLGGFAAGRRAVYVGFTAGGS